MTDVYDFICFGLCIVVAYGLYQDSLILLRQYEALKYVRALKKKMKYEETAPREKTSLSMMLASITPNALVMVWVIMCAAQVSFNPIELADMMFAATVGLIVAAITVVLHAHIIHSDDFLQEMVKLHGLEKVREMALGARYDTVAPLTNTNDKTEEAKVEILVNQADIPTLISELHHNVLYLFEKETDKFMCQGSSLDEAAHNLFERFRKIEVAKINHNDTNYWIVKGKVCTDIQETKLKA